MASPYYVTYMAENYLPRTAQRNSLRLALGRYPYAARGKSYLATLPTQDFRNILLPSSASLALGKPPASFRGIILAH